MVSKLKAMFVAGILVSGSFAATHVSAGIVTAGLANFSAPSVVTAADGSASNLKSNGLLIKVANNGKGKGRGNSNGGGNGNGNGNGSSSSGGNGSSTSSSSGGGSVPVPSPLFLILGMAGVAVMRRRKSA